MEGTASRRRPTAARRRACRARPLLAAGLLLAALLPGCGPRRAPATRLVWGFGREPADLRPWGRPDPAAQSLRHLLYRGLVDEDPGGRIVPAAAERWEVSGDSLEWTFQLRSGLRFTDGAPCSASDFRRAFHSALRGEAAGSAAWMLWSVQGVDRFRGRAADTLAGVRVVDPRTLKLKLARRDPLLLAKLAHPLCGAPVSPRAPARDSLIPAGLGPYRVVSRVPGRRLVLAGALDGVARPRFDTLIVEFATGARRLRAGLRERHYDLLWPLPAGLPAAPVPAGYRQQTARARPAQWLLMVFRCDLPPTSKPAARRALAHALNRAALVRELGGRAEAAADWLAPGAPLQLPAFDREAVLAWMERGRLGRSLHVQMGFARGGLGEELARSIQAGWATQALDAELRPMGPAALRGALRGGGPQVMLVEDQPLLDTPAARMAGLARPARGGAVGGFRCGWAPRGFDDALWPRRQPRALDQEAARQALEAELPFIPLARLPFLWLEREDGPGLPFHPRFGPDLLGRDSVAIRNVRPNRG